MKDWGKLNFISNSSPELLSNDIGKSPEFGVALDLLKMGTWEWDLKSNSINCSTFLLNLLNNSLKNELDINLIINQISPKDQNRVKDEIIGHIKNKVPFLTKFKFISKGQEYSLEVSGNPVLNAHGELVKVVGVIQDNSYREVVINSLIKSEYDLRKTEKIAHLGSWRWSVRQKRFSLNQELLVLLDNNQSEKLNYLKVKNLFEPQDWKELVKELFYKVNVDRSDFFKEAKVRINGVVKYIKITCESEFISQKLIGIHGTVQDVSQNKIVSDQLEYRMEFERMISAISSNFINLKNDKVNIAINIALDILGTFLDIDRSFLCLFNKDHSLARFNFLWARAGFEYPKNFEYKEFVSSEHYGLQETLKGETIALSDLSGLDDSVRLEKNSWFDKDIQSILCVPLYIEGSIRGTLGLQSIKQKKSWNPDEVNLIRMVGEVFINTLRRKEFEALQSNNEQFLSTIINSLSDGVFATNENGLITKMNTRAEELSGINKKTALGKKISEVLKFFNTDENSFNIAKQIIETGSSVFKPDLSTVVSNNQNMVPVQISGTPLRQYGVELNGCVILCRDMSNQVKLETQLRESEKMRLIGQLSGGIAHDFNNLLTGILGCANFLKKKHHDDSESLKFIDNILTTSRRATTLTSQLLAFSRREKPKLVGLDCHVVINEIFQLIEITFDPSIKIEISLNADKHIILGDVSQIHNAILNISMNAKDAMPNGGVLSIRSDKIKIEENQASILKLVTGLYLRLEISDTGTGISESLIENIFEPFFTTKEKGKGTGLGLAAVYGTIVSHKGSIQVESKLGLGSKFIIYLPILDVALEERIVEVDEPARLLGKTILVVDDEQLNCLVAQETLEDVGCNVLIEQNGLKAIELYKEQYLTIDLVVLDMLMPKIKGPDLLKKFVEINPKVKAIIASGYSGNLADDDIIKSRNVPFLQKPYEEIDFLDMIAEELGK